jgi:hypothetical protein
VSLGLEVQRPLPMDGPQSHEAIVPSSEEMILVQPTHTVERKARATRRQSTTLHTEEQLTLLHHLRHEQSTQERGEAQGPVRTTEKGETAEESSRPGRRGPSKLSFFFSDLPHPRGPVSADTDSALAR